MSCWNDMANATGKLVMASLVVLDIALGLPADGRLVVPVQWNLTAPALVIFMVPVSPVESSRAGVVLFGVTS